MSPSLSQETEHLRLADRHLVEGERRLTWQRLLIERMRGNSLDTAHAEAMLEAFEASLKLMMAHRQLILDGITRAQADGTP